MVGPWPVMKDNITRDDIKAVTEFLNQPDIPILTQGKQVELFEKEWGAWQKRKYNVFVNSGASANLMTMFALKETHGTGEVIVPALTWASDISSVLHAGMTPVFVDINPRTLGMDTFHAIDLITDKTKAVFITHVLGYNALDDTFIYELQQRGIPLIEDACESHGAKHSVWKVGNVGWASNFSFYYAHHMTTVEGGMISTDNPALYQTLLMMRSHGLVRSATSKPVKDFYRKEFSCCNPEFTFAYAAFNCRNTEINAVIGRNQLKRLDSNNEQRTKNLKVFLSHIDTGRFFTDFKVEGSCNYGFTAIMKKPDRAVRDRIETALKKNKIEYRRGASGGNQLRQPYLRGMYPHGYWKEFPIADHVHFYGFQLGNYPGIAESDIINLCTILNSA